METAIGVHGVQVTGELDLDTAAHLRGVLERALARRPARLRVLLEAVTFCDCAGLNVLLEARCRALAAGVSFEVTAPTVPVVARLFEVTGADRLLRDGAGRPGADGVARRMCEVRGSGHAD